MQRQGAANHGVSWKSNAEKWDAGKDGFPMLMPAALAELLWIKDYQVSSQLDGIDDFLGLETLRYNVLKVQDLVTGWSGCATIILPDPVPMLLFKNWTVTDDWMYQHGWYEPDPDCAQGEALYVFNTYFPQAWLLDPRFKVTGTLRHGANCNYTTPDPWPVDDATLGMIYPKGQWPYKEGMQASELQLNLSAVWEYGTRMGRTISVDSDYGMSTKGAGGVYTFYETRTPQKAGCRAPACTVLAVGTATILAWSGQNLTDDKQVRSFYTGLTLLKNLPDSQEWLRHGSLDWEDWVNSDDIGKWKRSADAASAYRWCSAPGSGSLEDLGYAAVPSFDSFTFAPFCDSAICNHTVNNCSFWDEKGIGFVHGAGNLKGGYNPHSVSDLIGVPFYFPIDKNVFPMFPGSGTDALSKYHTVLAVADVMASATTVLKRHIAAEMANTDSVRSVMGAIIDTTIIMVAILAMASGHRDLQELLVKIFTKISIGRVGVPLTARRISKFTDAVVMLLTWAVIGASVLLAPALTLAAEVSARENNPTPDNTTQVNWVSAQTVDGNGPYTVTAAVVSSISAESSEAALAITFVNVVIATIATILLWVVVWRDQMQGRLQGLQQADQEEIRVAKAQQQQLQQQLTDLKKQLECLRPAVQDSPSMQSGSLHGVDGVVMLRNEKKVS